MPLNRHAPLSLISLLALLSCAPDKAACVPGETQRCLCPDQSDGAQSCEAEGSSWSECVCAADADPGADDGEDTHSDDDSSAPTDTGSTSEGYGVYLAWCSACHGADGRGASGPDLRREVPELSDAELRRVITEGEDEMPGFDLSGEDLSALVAWLRASFGSAEEEEEEDDD